MQHFNGQQYSNVWERIHTVYRRSHTLAHTIHINNRLCCWICWLLYFASTAKSNQKLQSRCSFSFGCERCLCVCVCLHRAVLCYHTFYYCSIGVCCVNSPTHSTARLGLAHSPAHTQFNHVFVHGQQHSAKAAAVKLIIALLFCTGQMNSSTMLPLDSAGWSTTTMPSSSTHITYHIRYIYQSNANCWLEFDR